MKRIKLDVKKILVTLIVLFFATTMLQQFTKMISVGPLQGALYPAPKSDFHLKSWFDGDYQEKENNYLKENFGFRNWFVRLYNQVIYSCFNQTNANGVVIGKEGYLYEEWYIDSYFGGTFVGTDSINRQLKRLKLLQDTLRNNGKTFLTIFAPGKAYFLPEYIPDRYVKHKDSANFETFLAIAKNLNLNILDLNSYFINQKNRKKYPLYSKNGTHWSYYGMCLAADTIIRHIEQLHGVNMANIYWSNISESREKEYDYDIASAMNIFETKEGLVMGYPSIQFSKDSAADKPNVLVIADSYYFGMFNFGVWKSFGNNRLRYYNKEILPESYTKILHVNDVSLKQEISENDVIMLLTTDANLQRFGWGFIEDAYGLYFEAH